MLFLIIFDRIIYKHIVKSDLSIIVDPNQADIRYPVDPSNSIFGCPKCDRGKDFML